MDRIACGTFLFRSRFPDLSLIDFPAFLADRLKVHQIEIFSGHFPDTSLDYCRRVRDAADRSNSKVINLQMDQPGYNLSSEDKSNREKSVQSVKKWMDRAMACGSTSLRANTGRGKRFDLETTADSFRRLAEYGASIGLKVLVENHGGHSNKAENIVAIIKAVNSSWLRSLPDFGNIQGNDEKRHSFLKKILPYADLISAKGMYFDDDMKHSPYDIGACVRLAESVGFKGIYSLEQWAPKPIEADDLSVARYLIQVILGNLS
ncbi:MAG TPA: sugar phosphate isomerase/epimerase [Verrucomicrobiales bacterium]|nr:sugar phosphate isomerase/epimerase [Verrucomicrobiales bacterium]